MFDMSGTYKWSTYNGKSIFYPKQFLWQTFRSDFLNKNRQDTQPFLMCMCVVYVCIKGVDMVLTLEYVLYVLNEEEVKIRFF